MSKFKIVLHTLGLEYIREGEENTPILHEKGSGLGLVFSVLCHLNGGKKMPVVILFSISQMCFVNSCFIATRYSNWPTVDIQQLDVDYALMWPLPRAEGRSWQTSETPRTGRYFTLTHPEQTAPEHSTEHPCVHP